MADDLLDDNQTAEPLSLRDELAAAMAGDGGDQAAAPAPAETPAQAAERVRDEAGRFAKPAEAGQIPSEAKTPQAGGEPPKPETIAPPASWSATAKANFAALPPVVQQEVLKREQDIEKGKAQWDQKAERFNRLDSLLAPRRERFQLAGLDDVQAVQALFAAQDYLERSPREGIAYLARQYGVDLRSFAQGGQQQAAPQPPMPPALQAMFQDVQSLKSVFAQQQQSAAQVAQSHVQSEITAFQSDPKNLYFENVKGDMAKLINSGQASGLQDAYDKATWANPEIRTLLLQQQQQSQTAQAQQAARAKADAARHASGSITGSPAPGSSPASSGPAPTLRDELARAFAEAGS